MKLESICATHLLAPKHQAEDKWCSTTLALCFAGHASIVDFGKFVLKW
jgi:hypothetical protein